VTADKIKMMIDLWFTKKLVSNKLQK
jgi:hypothetical protein